MRGSKCTSSSHGGKVPLPCPLDRGCDWSAWPDVCRDRLYDVPGRAHYNPLLLRCNLKGKQELGVGGSTLNYPAHQLIS